jgi:hypothetical protein
VPSLKPKVPDLILMSREAASRRMNDTSGAAWFETALTRLLTMRVLSLRGAKPFWCLGTIRTDSVSLCDGDAVAA